jgi:hypothetical protein
MIIELEEQVVTGKILVVEIMLEEETTETVADNVTTVVAKAVVGATTELAEAAKTEIQAIATLKKDTNWLTIVRK